MTKTFIWLGLFIGSSIGGAIPMIWGESMLSVAGMLLSVVGAIAGIFAGWKLGQMVG